MMRAIGLLVGFVLALSACTQRMICPAYQSSFIHDPKALQQRFSYFNPDSTPKVITVSKNRYLIIPEQSYRKKIRSMQTIEMKPIYPKIPDSLQEKSNTVVVGAEQDASDTLTSKKKPEDSVYQITKDKEVRLLKYDPDSMKYRVENIKYTAEQDNYMWYFRDILVLPDVKAAMNDEKNAKEEKANGGKAVKKEKKGFFGFFKGMFSKKPKTDSTKAEQGSAPAATDSTVQAKPREKKGLFGFLKKKKTEAKPPEQKKDPAKKEEDGF